MRIVSGVCKGRIINPPKNLNARPTTDFAKENIFNIITNNFDYEDLKVLDLFSGTGSISFEFASRGASEVISVEMNGTHQKFIAEAAKTLKLLQIKSIKMNAFTYLKVCKDSFDIIFADPPYELDGIDAIPEQIFAKELLKKGGWLIFEHSKNKDYSNLQYFHCRRSYGSVNFSIFTW